MTAEAKRYRLLGQIAAAESLKDSASPLVELACLEFAPQSVIFMLFGEDHVPVSLIRWIPDDLLRHTFDNDYFDLGYLLDPFALKAVTETGISAYRIFEIAPDRFEGSEYYANYYRKTGMVDELGALLRIDDKTVAHLSLGRNAGYQKYSTRETRKFKLICPAITPKLAKLAAAETTERVSVASPRNLAEIFRNLEINRKKRLSQREADIAALITQGHSSRSISINLGISIHTVKVHRRNIYRKLSISAQNELFGLAMTHGAESGRLKR